MQCNDQASLTSTVAAGARLWLVQHHEARPIYAVEFEGKRHDTGEKRGFLKATVEFALARPDLADQFRAYLRSLDL